MRFLSIIKANEAQGQPPQALMDAIDRFIATSLQDGTLVQTGGLARSSAGARVRISASRLTVTDGPFAEAKEVVGGYAMLEAPSREKAIESTVAFMRLHLDHWPEWQGECELREVEFLAP
jgi:hypothetical protein